MKCDECGIDVNEVRGGQCVKCYWKHLEAEMLPERWRMDRVRKTKEAQGQQENTKIHTGTPGFGYEVIYA